MDLMILPGPRRAQPININHHTSNNHQHQFATNTMSNHHQDATTIEHHRKSILCAASHVFVSGVNPPNPLHIPSTRRTDRAVARGDFDLNSARVRLSIYRKVICNHPQGCSSAGGPQPHPHKILKIIKKSRHVGVLPSRPPGADVRHHHKQEDTHKHIHTDKHANSKPVDKNRLSERQRQRPHKHTRITDCASKHTDNKPDAHLMPMRDAAEERVRE